MTAEIKRGLLIPRTPESRLITDEMDSFGVVLRFASPPVRARSLVQSQQVRDQIVDLLLRKHLRVDLWHQQLGKAGHHKGARLLNRLAEVGHHVIHGHFCEWGICRFGFRTAVFVLRGMVCWIGDVDEAGPDERLRAIHPVTGGTCKSRFRDHSVEQHLTVPGIAECHRKRHMRFAAVLIGGRVMPMVCLVRHVAAASANA